MILPDRVMWRAPRSSTGRHPSAILLVAAASVASASAQLPPPFAFTRVTELRSAPAWLAAPEDGHLSMPPGVSLKPQGLVVISREDTREGALLGFLVNAAVSPVESLSLTFEYLDEHAHPVGVRVANQAGVTRASPGQRLPFRFPLVAAADLPVAPAGYRVRAQLEGGRDPVRPGSAGAVDQTRTDGNGLLVSGFVSAPQNRRDTARVTVAILDEDGLLLEIVSGATSAPDALTPPNAVPFTLETRMPIGRLVRRTEVWVEVAAAGAR